MPISQVNLSEPRYQLGAIKSWMLITLMLIFWAWFFKIAPLDTFKLKVEAIYTKIVGSDNNDQSKQLQKFILKAPKDKDVCDATFPDHGLKYKLTPHSQDAKLHARVYVSNEHIYPMLLTFISNRMPYGAMIIHPKQGSEVSLPIGHYQLQIESGETWCNVYLGFDDGEYITTSTNLDVVNNQVTRLRLISIGNSHSDVLLSLNHALGVVPYQAHQQIDGTGVLHLQAVMGGHYAIEGRINHLPAYFLVDTGATHVSVSTKFARQAGIQDCQPSMMSTANGVTKGCIGTANILSIGQFTLHNVKVAYNDGMSEGIFLLGMNVISQFKLEQQGDVMQLSLP